MIDLKFLRENPEVVKQNIKNKFQDHKLPLVDEVNLMPRRARHSRKQMIFVQREISCPKRSVS